MTVTSRRSRGGKRSALALAVTAATATVLGATALTVPAHAAPAPDAPKLDLKDGTLEWGVKESFRGYVTGPIGGGRIEVADGAKQAADNGAFTFTDGTGTYDTSTHAVATTFKGSVRFLAHAKGDAWELDLKLTDLKLSTQGKTGSITADVTAAGKTENDVAIASLDLSAVRPGGGAGGAMTYPNIPAKLTAGGAKAFAYHKDGKVIEFYKEGQALDPATLTVKAAGGGQQPSPKPTPTQKPSPKPTVQPKPSATPTVKPTQKPGSSGNVLDGNLDWGVKKSFRDYVTGPIAGGKAELSAGAVKSGDGYRFPKGRGTYDAKASSLDANFTGAVRFTGHEGQLDLKFSDLKVKANGTTGTLLADVSAKARATGKVTRTDDMPVAKLKLPAGALKARNGVVSLSAVPATLTAQGAKAFDNMYKEGQALDPLTAAVSVDKSAKLPGGGTGKSSVAAGTTGGSGGVTGGTGTAALAATGADTPTGPLLGGAGALLLAGGTAVYAARRRQTTGV
ncbi:HtaA domain-containing protein [Streptomyces syringium]|uniref:HtaA domain-containing protein n=1 Tax=Streptomyces syringium TaxID=76729 RepID=UPI00342A0018